MASDLNTYGLNKKLPSSFAGRPSSSSSNNGIPLGRIRPWFLPNMTSLAHGDGGELAPEDPRTVQKEKAIVNPLLVSYRLGNSLWDKNALHPKSIWDERSFESGAYNSIHFPRRLVHSSNHEPRTFDQAKAIMLWAARESENPSNFPLLHPIAASKRSISPLPTPMPCPSSTPSPPTLQSPIPPGELNQHEEPLKPNSLLPTCPTAHKVLPQARKASLARFLEKRRERVLSKAPYGKKISPPQDTSQGDTELSTNCGPACPPRRRVSNDYSDEKMSHTSKQVEFRMDMEYSAEHELAPTRHMYETED